MAINLNDATPAAINSGNNVHWQEDGSGNVSAYYQIRKSIITAIPFLTIDLSTADSFFINIGLATTFSFSNPTDGQEFTLIWQQGATPFAVTPPSGMLGMNVVAVTANTKTAQRFSYNAADTTYVAIPATGV